jgi:hypothetical protein
MPENFRTKSILFDVAEVSLPFNAILGRPAMYQFMAVAHYGYLVLKIPSPNGILKIYEDLDASVSALEKLQALAAAGSGSPDQAPSSSRQCGSSSAPRVQPSGKEDAPVKTIQIGADAAQTTRIAGDLDNKWKLTLVIFLWANVDVFAWQPSQMPGILRKVIEHHLKIYPTPNRFNRSPGSSP